MTGDEKVPADFDSMETVHHGVNAAVDENGGPIHHTQTNGYEHAAKVV